MASGVKVADEVYDLYNVMKLGKKHRYLEMNIVDGFITKKLMVEKSEDQRKDFEDMVNSLGDNCCYLLLDLDVPSKGQLQQSEKVKNEKLYIITWCPDTGKTKEKMTYAASKSALHDKIGEGTKRLQANDISDLDFDALLALL